MAGDDSKPSKSIPAWQQASSSSSSSSDTTTGTATTTTTTTTTTTDSKEELAKTGAESEELLDVARQFLKDDSIRDATRHDKVEFLKEKGLSDSEVEKLLAEETNQSSSNELKTIHDTTSKPVAQQQVLTPPPTQRNSSPAPVTRSEPRPDVAPVITYPEFLLKPQKPPPLITVSRLVNAAYAIAGVSALTWGASKYIIEPMLHTLTEARHDFADTTKEDLERLNEKLEGMVSHVPYIASTASKRTQDRDEDADSIDSDPTELFHRDIATQTTPGLSRSSSETSLTRLKLDPTISQSERLSGLSYSLKTLVTSLDHTIDNEKYLQETVKDFQSKLTTMESSYSLLRNDFYNSTSIYSSAAKDTKKTTAENQAQKFKQEIRGLKGAFLSSRNFPTAPRPTAAVGGSNPR